MRLKAISIEGFRGFVERADIDLAADVIILHGPNGVGKTSLLDAILWAMTGRIERFSGKGNPLSLYAREGLARVELTLSTENGDAVLIRASDGAKDNFRIRHGDNEFDGSTGESRLADLLMPQLRNRVVSPSLLSSILTRGVYLQQDLVRQFVETDAPTERFSILSEVIGAGAVLELQQALEKSRNQWSRSTNALRKESLDPLGIRRDQIVEQLARLDAAGSTVAIDARAAISDLFQKAITLIGQTRLSLTQPPTNPSGLDRLLKEVAVERSRIERDLSTTLSLRQESSVIASSLPDKQAEVDELKLREHALDNDIAELERRVTEGMSALAQSRQRQIENANKLSRLATLAALALEELGDICPVCQQQHDVEKTKLHLQELIVASSTKPEDLKGAEEELEQLIALRSRSRAEAEEVRRQLHELQSVQSEFSNRQSLLRTRLKDIGIVGDIDVPTALDLRRQALETALASVTDLLRSGEQLTLEIVRISEQQRRGELTQERNVLENRIAEVSLQLKKQDETHALAGRIIDALRGASLQITRKQVESVAPLFQRIYSRIDPHPTFRVTQIVTDMERGKGFVKVGVSDPEQGGDPHEPIPILSSSQLNSFAVSLFLALNLATPSLRLGITMLDDPLQSLDSINLLGLVDVLRRFRAHRQIIVSTHEARLLGLLQRKLRPVRRGERLVTIAFEEWSRGGPSFKTFAQSYEETETVLAA